MKKKLYRNTKNKMVSGVCSGIADYLNIDPTIIRLIWAIITAFTAFFAGIILYVIFAIVIPEEPEVYDYSDYEQQNNQSTTYYEPPFEDNHEN